MTIATKITISRVLLVIPTVVFYIIGMLVEDVYIPLLIAACVIFSLLCMTDFVDGYIARKTGTVSSLGKFLDPLADKILIVVMLFLIVYFRDFSLFPYDVLVIAILSGLIMTRELTISILRAIAASKNLVLGADIFGKAKTIFLDFGVAFLILAGVNDVIMWIGEILFFIGAVITVFSGIRYIINNKHILKDISSVKDDSVSQSDVPNLGHDESYNGSVE